MKFKKLSMAIEWCWLIRDVRYVGYSHDYYDGDFWSFGFWFFHVFATNNPHFYLTEAEMDANVAKWEANHRE